MTNRINSLTVALEHDIREDDVESLISAIRQLRGVLDVTTHVVTPDSWVAYERARREIAERLFDALEDDES